MKRYIFIVDDEITDIYGYLLTLQVFLAPKLMKQSPQDLENTSICFLHTCWHDDECVKADCASRFDNAFQHVQGELKALDRPMLRHADYKYVALDGRDYSSNHPDRSDEEVVKELVDKMVGVQKEYLREQKLSEAFVDKFPDGFHEETICALLLDIILNKPNGIDQSRIQERRPVLSTGIYARFPKERCITYTTYKGYYGDEWAALAKVSDNDKPILREWVTRPRATHIQFRERLYHILDL